METSGRALIDHWTWAAAKGVMNKNTAGGIRAACSQVLEALGEDLDGVDVRTLDVDGALRRFENLKKKEFKPPVLAEYKRRFRNAVKSYLAYLEDPGGWRPAVREGRPGGAERNGGGRSTSAPPPEAAAVESKEIAKSRVMEYPFPLREGLIARLILPVDLRASEVKRLAAFMNTLVAEEQAAQHDSLRQ